MESTIQSILGHPVLSVTALTFSIAVIKLLYQYYNPVIITYPWGKQQRQKQDKQKIVVIAGSYNPPHQGHLVMIEYLASRYKKVLVVVGMNPNKRYAVSPATRAGILERMVQTLGDNVSRNVKVEGML